ncbi:MAG TPA: methyltransferase domain-containing protein [Vicinamibacterales bacterium]|nr:methyltransferase domain-containing protein [Vicinamibacterales bacterium]
MSDRRPLIVIGVPCYGTVAPDVLEDWMVFAYHCGRRMPDYDFQLAIKTKSEQFRARNAIVEAARQANADWLLMLDDDMVINPLRETLAASTDYSFLSRLLAHDKDVCGALYYQRTGECAPVLMAKAGEHGYRFLRDDELTGRLQRVDVAGGGCLLIKMRVFDRLKPPYFAPEHKYGTDVQLCRAAAEAGFEVWADTSIELGHVREERVIVTSRNRHQFQTSDTLPGEVKRQFIASDVYRRLEADAATWTGYRDLDEMRVYAQAFLGHYADWKAAGRSDLDWYRSFPKERVCRQLWFNVESAHKRQMTEFILGSINHRESFDILDFGCGIGIPAFTLAEKGHRVTACDLRDTGTFQFLQWRARQYNVPITFHGIDGVTDGGVPHFGDRLFDIIIAMDCLEHLPDWRDRLALLVRHLRPGGVLFANNAVLDDTTHPEHYDLKPKDFLRACADLDLIAQNAITYVKRAAPSVAESRPQEFANA